MTPYYSDASVTLYAGDCLDVMRELPDASVDSVVTDPPYSLGFMGRSWDTHSGDHEDAGFAYWFTGFVDGEGCFRVQRHERGSYTCTFSIKVRRDERGTLEHCQRALGGIGTIREGEGSGNAHPQVTWAVQDKAGCQRLVRLFDKYPLRAKKRLDYVPWAEAVVEWSTMTRGNRWHGQSDWSSMASLKARVEEARAYRDPPWSGHGYQDWCRQWAAECLRVLKPGGHLLSFGGTRTSHRLACAVEDAGFEIRDSITWLYGSGFPKSLDVSKAIDKAAGAEREVVGSSMGRPGYSLTDGNGDHRTYGLGLGNTGSGAAECAITAPATPDAVRWQGWGTALKPASEPIVVARKPLRGTVAGNVLAFGTGALNIAACRVAHTGPADLAESQGKNRHEDFGTLAGGNEVYGDYSMVPPRNYDGAAGRWPPNVVLDDTRYPVVRLRDSLPVDVERIIREFFGASTDHLPSVRDNRDSAAEPGGAQDLLLTPVLRGMDGGEHDGREGVAPRQGAHTGVAGEDATDAPRGAADWTKVGVMDRRPAPVERLRDGESVNHPRGAAPHIPADGDIEAQRHIGLRAGAPPGDGAVARASVDDRGAGTSRQRRTDGQPPREPRDARPRIAQPRARTGGGAGASVAAGERRPAGAPVELLRCYVPDGWLNYFDLTGRSSESQAAELDRQSGILTSGGGVKVPEGSTHGFIEDRVSTRNDSGRRFKSSAGGASRFFPTFRYEAKAPTHERPTFWTHSCECEDAWPTPMESRARATDATTGPGSSSTSRSGSVTTGDPSLTGTRSTTSTATSSTTIPPTLSPSLRPSTSGSTPAATSETGNGGSPAVSVAEASRSVPPTGISAAKAGPSTAGVGLVTSPRWSPRSVCGSCGAPSRREAHATVKPLDLMRWLVRLVTPPGGICLDPFAGSGTTAEACVVEGFRCVLIEREPTYLPLIVARLSKPIQPDMFGGAA